MASRQGPSTGVDRLIWEIFEGVADDPLADELAAWAASGRFRSFLETHRDKVRKKIRGSADAESRRDVRTELVVARQLVADKAIELQFEAYGAGKAGPDFTVACRGERMNLEVTRLHGAGSTELGGPLLGKLHQFPPSVANVLVIADDRDGLPPFDVDEASRLIRRRADRKDEAFFEARGFEGSRGFYAQYLRLSAVVLWSEHASAAAGLSVWYNRSARIEAPRRALAACVRCLERG